MIKMARTQASTCKNPRLTEQYPLHKTNPPISLLKLTTAGELVNPVQHPVHVRKHITGQRWRLIDRCPDL